MKTKRQILKQIKRKRHGNNSPTLFGEKFFPNCPTPGIDKISDREIVSDVFFFAKIIFRKKKSNPMTMFWKNIISMCVFQKNNKELCFVLK